ncbi:MAG: hypothetical protein ACKN9V_05500 [Pseudomonadota bacterium]
MQATRHQSTVVHELIVAMALLVSIIIVLRAKPESRLKPVVSLTEKNLKGVRVGEVSRTHRDWATVFFEEL